MRHGIEGFSGSEQGRIKAKFLQSLPSNVKSEGKTVKEASNETYSGAKIKI